MTASGGKAPYTYQWYYTHSGSIWPQSEKDGPTNATTSTYKQPNAVPDYSGRGETIGIYCIVTDADNNSVTSKTVGVQ